MALPDDIKRLAPSAANRIIYADATDWPAGGSGGWGDDDDQIDLTGVAAGAARESDKLTLPVNMEEAYEAHSRLEFATAPISGETWDWHTGHSPSATAGTSNPGGLVGADGDYTGTAGDSLDDSLKALDFLGSHVLTADATTVVQQQRIGILDAPALPYMMVVGDNNSSDAIHSDAVECCLAFVGQELQIQD